MNGVQTLSTLAGGGVGEWAPIGASLWAFALSALRLAAPLQLALIGETLTQRTGVVNLGIEGQMLLGAMAGYGAAAATGQPGWALLAGPLAGALLSLVHAALVLRAGAPAFASGLAVWMLGFGASAYFGSQLVGQKLEGSWSAGFALPAGVSASVALALLLWVALSLWFWRTRPGLAWRATGDAPEAARAAGLQPTRVRLQAIVTGGLLAGLGGAALSVDLTRTWAEGMTEGRGLVAVGLVIVARANPWLTLPAALVFGGAEALALRLQASGVAVSAPLLQTLPYLLSLLVMTLALVLGRRHRGPFSN